MTTSTLGTPSRFLTPKRLLIAAGVVIAVLIVYFVMTTGACGCVDPGAGMQTIVVHNSAGKELKVKAEIADEPKEWEHGLTGRTRLGENSGMFFDIPQKGPGFWMKDVPIPLDVAFISRCGEIVAIAEMQPNSEFIHSTDRDYRFGLETNGGWFARNEVKVGDRVDIPAGMKQSGC